MYWPCGAPQIFAHRSVKEQIPDPGWKQPQQSTSQNDDDDSERPLSSNPQTSTQADSSNPSQTSPIGIIDLSVSRSDRLFTILTQETLEIWSVRPTVALASLSRSSKSLETYGANVSVSFRPDTSIIVIRTTGSYLITYSIENESGARVLQQQYGFSQSRRQSVMRNFGVDETTGFPEILLRFRKAIKIDAGIGAILTMEKDLIVSTIKPAAVQCIAWDSQKDTPHATTQLLSKLDWMKTKGPVMSMVHDRAMNLSVWLSQDGYAYAVQRKRPQVSRAASSSDTQPTKMTSGSSALRLFEGYCFHQPEKPGSQALMASINARFSLISIATTGGGILCYAAKDYAGNIPSSHHFRTTASPAMTGRIKSLVWSPDGYCLFAAFEHGWATWSVFGKEGFSTFNCNLTHAEANKETWLTSLETANWISGGTEILLTCPDEDRIWKLEMSRSAATSSFSCANLVRALLQTPTKLNLYRGHEMPDLTSISNETSLWHHAQYPALYLNNQWPIRLSVVSQDGRYVAIAGRRGLAHYSVQSGRWKTFSDHTTESSFAVRGGMCWFNHILAVSTEHAGGYDLRLYSRELDLGRLPLHVESFSMPIVFVGPSGEDSLLVYTYENVLYHYVISVNGRSAQLVQVGQIAFHGVVRAPSRVRSVSWVLPDSQLRNGDPSRDVEFASVLFLVDDKLVLLQPSRTPTDELKYDMRVIAHRVEYYILMRDQIYFNFTGQDESEPPTPSPGALLNNPSGASFSLRDSLWIFSGEDLEMWSDIREVVQHASEGDLTLNSPLLSVPVDFYPLSILLTKGAVLGIESELLQRRDVSFGQFRTSIRTQLFLPYALRHQLSSVRDTAAAFSLANQYQYLSYFPHALEMLLHLVLDDEVEIRRKQRKTGEVLDDDPPGPLPAVLSFLQMVLAPITYLSTVVQCVRKTELSSWKTLFYHLPPPLVLFEQALEIEDLKTASGYLIVLQGLEEEEAESDDDISGDESMKHESQDDDSSEKSVINRQRKEREAESVSNEQKFESYVVRLMTLARQKNDFEMCSELARFMMGIDPRGNALRRVIAAVGFRPQASQLESGQSPSARTGPGEAGLGLILSSSLSTPQEPTGRKRPTPTSSGMSSHNPSPSPRSSTPKGAPTAQQEGESGNHRRGVMPSKIVSPIAETDYFTTTPGGYTSPRREG